VQVVSGWMAAAAERLEAVARVQYVLLADNRMLPNSRNTANDAARCFV